MSERSRGRIRWFSQRRYARIQRGPEFPDVFVQIEDLKDIEGVRRLEDGEVDTRVILAVIPEQGVDSILATLHEQGFRVTRIASTGGFWRRGNVTLLIGVAEGQIGEVIGLLRDRCSARRENRRGRGEGNGGVAFILNTGYFERV